MLSYAPTNVRKTRICRITGRREQGWIGRVTGGVFQSAEKDGVNYTASDTGFSVNRDTPARKGAILARK